MNLNRLISLAQKVIASTQSALPEPLRDLARGVPVLLAAVPSEDLVHEGIELDTLGLFSGPAQGDDRSGDHLLPAQIHLFLANIWDYAEGDLRNFEEEVRVTYLHELGHFFGWDEGDLAARGLD